MTTTWTTRDGREIKISEMEDSHLINTINYLRRKNIRAVMAINLEHSLDALIYASTAPDGAAMAAESYSNDVLDNPYYFDKTLAEELPVFAALLAEASRRKLKTDLELDTKDVPRIRHRDNREVEL